MSDEASRAVVITAVDRDAGVVTTEPRDMRAEIGRAYNDALGQALTTNPNAGHGLRSWYDLARPEDAQFFGVDRTAPCDAFMREYPGTWKLTLRDRVRGAWRGMVNGWRGAE